MELLFTTDEILKMLGQAGFQNGIGFTMAQGNLDNFQKFANLVAAKILTTGVAE